jgi:mannose-6-phosphate isomerase-like protein (cupin superfamily)
MPSYPYTIDNGHGEALTWLRVVREAGGDRIEAEGRARPGAGPPMHVHYLQEEAVRVVSGKVGYQLLGGEEQFAGPGEIVVWPPGTAHRWWNAGADELVTTGWCKPADNIEFFLGAIFASVKSTGKGRPDIFDAAYLTRRYRSEYAMLAIPMPVQRIVFPIVVIIGTLLGKYKKYANAPAPIAR